MTNIEFLEEHIEQLEDALKECEENHITELAESIKTELSYWQLILKELKALEIVKKHKLLNYVLKNPKCAQMYHLTDEEIEILNEYKGARRKCLKKSM